MTTITVERELLPCPFCGGNANDLDYGQDYWVGCPRCQARTGDFGSREDADAAWNRRTLLSVQPVEQTDNAEALRKAIERICTLEGLIATIKHRCHLPDWARDEIRKAL